MTLLQLQYFRALARTLHYTRTAEQLRISQPSLSYAISELEKELGVKLFRKENQKVLLTIYGQQFLPYVDRALSLLQEGTSTLNQMRTNSSQIVRLGYFQSISASVIPTLIDGFYKQYSAEHILFHFTECSSLSVLGQLHSGALDLGFSFHRADWAESIAVTRQNLYLAVPSSHPLASHTSASFFDFASEPQIMLGQSSSLRDNIDHAFYENNIIPNIAFEVRECYAALQYVSLGFGVSILPWIPAMDSPKIKFLPILEQNKEFTRTIYFTYDRTRVLSPAAQKVRDYVLENFSLNQESLEHHASL